MKKLMILLVALCFLVPAFAEEKATTEPTTTPATTPTTAPTTTPKEFGVYKDKNARENHYIPSGWMGDYGDIKLNDACMDNPHSGTTTMMFSFSAKKSQGQGWAGVYWQNPANNWGSKKGGFDLTGMTKLTFWARGAKGGEVIQKFFVGGIKGAYPDSVNIETDAIELTDVWKQYTINLAGKDLSYISGGFGWVTTCDLNSEGCTFYLDDIKYEADPAMKPEGKIARSSTPSCYHGPYSMFFTGGEPRLFFCHFEGASMAPRLQKQGRREGLRGLETKEAGSPGLKGRSLGHRSSGFLGRF